MGKRGPPPTPTSILRRRGSWRAGRNPQEPQPESGRPRCPRWLDQDAKAAWRRLVPQLDGMGVLARIDGNALARYCQMHARWRRAEEFLRDHGDTHVVKDAEGRVKGVKAFPQVRIAAQLAEQLLRLEQQFGMTPSARARLTNPQQDSHHDGQDKHRFLRVV